MTMQLIVPAALDSEELQALPPSKAEQIRATFLPMADMLQGFEEEYNAVMQEAAEIVTPEVSKRARRLRLDIAKIRVAAEKVRKEVKDEFLRACKAIDGTNNILKWAITEKEDALLAIEQHAERIEEERLGKVHAERLEMLAPYVEELPDTNFGTMEDDVWEAYLSAKKQAYADRLEAERVAAAERAERERLEALRKERGKQIGPVFNFFRQEEGEDLGTLSDQEFSARLNAATTGQAAHEAEQVRVRAENERLAREAAARQAELDRLEAERKAERDRLADLERAEQKRAEQEAEAARRAEARAAEARKAPVRKRLTAWVDSFALPDLPGDDHPTAAEIRAKHAAFQTWARKQIEVL
jgi:hypothetical protein